MREGMRSLFAAFALLLLTALAAGLGCGPRGLPKMPPPDYEQEPEPDAGAAPAPPAALSDAAVD